MARSLRLRLLAGAALWIAAALILAGLAIGYLFVDNIDANVRLGLSASLNRIVALLDPTSDPPGLTGALPDPRYDSPDSGIYWQVENLANHAMGRSRSLFDFTLSPPSGFPAAGENFVALAGPDGQSLSALIRTIRFDDQHIYRVIVAENRAPLNESIARFGLQLTLALIILGIVLAAAALLQVRLGLGPLGALRAGVEAVRKGRQDRLPTGYPAEVQGLVSEVNELLAAQEQSVRFAQQRASDLAHGLKTPLAVLGTIAADLRETGNETPAQSLEVIASEMAERIDFQLRLSRLRLRPRTHELSANLEDAVSRTLAVIRRTPEGEHLTIETHLLPLIVDIEPRDLIELVGALIENAAKWAGSRIELEAKPEDGAALLQISDDGPGLSPEDISRIGQRGQRLDESSKGSGLGVAIAHEIAALNGGRIRFGRAAMGGLEVRVTLPLARG
jgi:signal transduction histidine kinase